MTDQNYWEHFGSQITQHLGYIADNGRIMSFAPVASVGYVQDLE